MRSDTEECQADPGHMVFLAGHPGMYEYHYEGETSELNDIGIKLLPLINLSNPILKNENLLHTHNIISTGIY